MIGVGEVVMDPWEWKDEFISDQECITLHTELCIHARIEAIRTQLKLHNYGVDVQFRA